VRASQAQVRVTSVLALALLLVFIASLFFRTQLLPAEQLPTPETFVALSGVILVMADWIIATLLIAQARVLHARPLQVLAAGYLLAGLFMALRIISLRGALGSLDHIVVPTYNLPLWFYLSSHAALPLAIMAYVALSRGGNRPLRAEPARQSKHGHYLAKSIILVGTVILVLAAGKTALPWSSPTFLAASIVMVLTIGGMAALGRGLQSELDLWFLLMLWGWFLEMALIALNSENYTAGWYAARGLGLVSGLFVLFALLAESNKLYAQSVLHLIAQKQEREHRFLVRDVISASIAHELRQPLAATLINAEVARKIASDQGWDLDVQPDRIVPVLDDIIASSLRARDILENTRAMFGRKDSERNPVDPAVILRSTLALVESSARAQRVSVGLVMEGQPRPLFINRLQIQQALLNLFQNAIEALSQSDEPERTLLVRCSCWEDRGVTIRVEDNGPGIAPANRSRIFDAFFTTRPEGTGMGLVIVRSVIQAHGGRLEVEPRLPVGTTFVIHLPYGAQRPDKSVTGRTALWA
jgi:signal transduction histidine kinase